MVLMQREFVKIAVFHSSWTGLRHLTGVTVDWQFSQSIYRLCLWGWALMCIVDHKSPVHQFFSSCFERGRYAEMEWYWEFGNASVSPYRNNREREWDRRSAFWRAFGCEAIDRLYFPLVCRMRGHRYDDVWADAENGYEEVSCSRCGLTHHHYF